jgi:hypothetical protein
MPPPPRLTYHEALMSAIADAHELMTKINESRSADEAAFFWQ